MAETQSIHIRPDIDIEGEIHHLMHTGFMPLRHDRHQIDVTVNAGLVKVQGYVKSATTQSYLLNRIREVEGVKAIQAENFYNDEAIRLQLARLLPAGVLLTMEYGAVILEGKLPEGTTVEALVSKIATVPGVRRVLTSFR